MTLRTGVLGAARITQAALLTPARATPGVQVVAVAAREQSRAAAYARKHRIPVAHGSYQALLKDPEIDAVYLPLPPALHGQWALAALAAGKHVLVEKPFTADAEQAREVQTAAQRSGLVVLEAHHTCFHPFTARLREVVQSGELGEVRRATAWFHAPIPPGRGFRWDAGLGGGALMDLGVYPLRMIRDVLGEPTVTAARARTRGEVDATMSVQLRVGDVSVGVYCGMWSRRLLAAGFTVEGSRARMRVRSPYQPHVGGRFRIDGPGASRREKADSTSTYRYQLEAFRDAVLHGVPTAGSPSQAVATMQIVDDAYRAAGLRPRRPVESSR